MDRWTEMEVFVRATELGSISSAAETLGMSTSAASRHLSALERRLNARLINRSTRRQSLTEAGDRYFTHSRELLTELEEAEASVSEIVVQPTGVLRISASLSFCLEILTPLLPDFCRAYPELRIDMVSSNRYYDILENGVDVAIRTRRVEADSSVTIRRLAETRRRLAASPAYLERHGTPAHPHDLAAHAMLLYTLADRHAELDLRRGEERVVVPVKGLMTCNDGQILRRAARDGMGILAQPSYIIEKDLADGTLTGVLDDWDLPRLTVNIAYPSRAHLPTKVRVFIEFLVDSFRKGRHEARWVA